MKLTKLDKIDIAGKSFVFDSSLTYFRCGGEWITRDEYFKLNFPHSDGYLSEFDKENPIVMKITEAGGFVRKSISGKTDYYVVGKSQQDSPAKNRDYQQQLAKGNSIVAISADNLLQLLGVDENSEAQKDSKKRRNADKYGLVKFYKPDDDASFIHPDNIEVEDVCISGSDCKDWEYAIAENTKKVYLTDYIGDAEEVILPTFIDGKKVELTWVFAEGGCRFEKCKAKKVSIPGSYKEVPPDFFANNNALEEIVVGYGIEELGFSFCAGAEHLRTIHIPDTIREVGFGCLEGTEWDMKQGSEAIAGPILIHKYGTRLRWSSDAVYCVPEGVTCIAEHAFYSGDDDESTYYIHNLELPKTLKNISKFAFFMLPMDSLKIAAAPEHIGSRAFRGTRIANYYRDKKHESMLIVGDILCEIFTDNCRSTLEVPDGVRIISDEAMQGTTGRPEQVILPDTLEELGKRIQWGEPLRKIRLSKNLKRMGESCFSGCKNLTEIDLPEGLSVMGSSAFSYSGLKDITIPGSVRKIQHFTFGRCSDLETVKIMPGVETVGDSAFEECKSLIKVELPDTLKRIEYRAFAMCESLKSIQIPASVEEIDPEAFAECGEVELIVEDGSYAYMVKDKLTISQPDKNKKGITVIVRT